MSKSAANIVLLGFQAYYMPNKIILICIWIRSLHFLVQFSYIFSPYGIRVTIHLLILTEGFIGRKRDKGILLCSILLQDVCITKMYLKSEVVANIIYLGYHITSALIEAKVLRLRTLVP